MNIKSYAILFVLLFHSIIANSQCACCAGASLGSANTFLTNGASALPKHSFAVELSGDYRTIKKGMTKTDEDEQILKSLWINSLGLRYAFSQRLSVATMLPYVMLETDSGHDQGLGDVMLTANYLLYSKNFWNISLQGGIELPTGIRKQSNFDNTTVSIGSGSYDPMLSINASKKLTRYIINASAMYKHTTNGFNGNYYGSVATQSISVGYWLNKPTATCTIDSLTTTSKKLNTMLSAGYNGEWLDKTKEDGVVDENSGHYLGFANLAIHIFYNKWTISATYSLPVINNVYGQQNQAASRVKIGLMTYF